MNRHSFHRRVAMASALFVILGALAACGSGGGGDGGKKDGDSVTIAVAPFLGFALPWYAQERGYFKDEGLTVTLKSVSAGASVMLPLTSSGDVTFGAAGAADALPAIIGGAPISFIADVGTALTGDIKTSGNVLVAKDPSIQRPRDLEGKKVAFNSLGGIQEILTRAAVRKDGGDDTKVKFIKLPQQNIPDAISKGEVDAGQAIEPFLTSSLAMGLHAVTSVGGVLEGAPELAYFVNSKWAKEHAGSVEAFSRAMKRAMVDVNKDPDLLRTALSKNTDADPATTAKLRAVIYTDKLPASEFERLATFLTQEGLLGKAKTASDWVITPKS